MNAGFAPTIATTADIVGVLTAGASAVIALFFLRWWRDSRDRLFLIFAIAFAILAVNRIALFYFAEDESRSLLYWVRFVAYLCILGAIIDKNRRS